MVERVFRALAAAAFDPGAAVRTDVFATERTSLKVWRVPPGQGVAAHRHPLGQDTWVVLRGAADYLLGGGARVQIGPGDVAVAPEGAVHGCVNAGAEEFVFVSMLSPAACGFEAATPDR